MNVEGGLIGSVGSVASAVGSSIVNEGPVAPSFLENTMPLTVDRFNPVGEIIFNPEPLSAVDAIFEAESIISEAKISHQTVSVLNLEIGLKPIPRPMDFIWIEPKVHPDIQQIKATKIALENAGLTDLSIKVAQLAQSETKTQENLVEQIVEEEVVEEVKLKNLLDEEVAQQRVYEIGEAIDLAKAEAEKDGVDEIEGWRIVKFLPPEHPGNRSQIVKERGPDGSLSETLEELAARKFSSKNQAKEQSSEIVARKEPVKKGKEGKTVTEGAVERVFKYHLVKFSPQEEVFSG